MLKLTKTGIGLLTRQYRSVLKKCLLINAGLFAYFSFDGASAVHFMATKYVGGETVYMYCESWTDCYNKGGGMIYSMYNSIEVNNTLDNYYQKTDKISIGSDGDGGNINFYDVNGTRTLQLTNTNDPLDGSEYAQLRFFNPSGSIYTYLDYKGFRLNGSDTMTGITHNTAVAANASSTVAKLVSESTLARSLNNYYRKNKKSGILNGVKEGEIGNENNDNFSKSVQNIKAVNDNFALNNGDFSSNNPSRLGAFAKCEKACPRLSERFPASLEKNSAFEQYSRSARGTFLFVSQTHKNVLDNFYKNSQCLKASNDNFATTTFLRAI